MALVILDAIQEVLKTENKLENAAHQIAKDIRQNIYDITELCTRLEGVLTSPVSEQRVQGTLLLSRVLHQLPKDLLSDQQLNVLAIFYADRLKDHHNVVPAVIEGINALIRMAFISSTSVLKLIQSLSLNITCQSQLRNDRYNIYTIFQYLTYSNTTEFKELSSDFVYEVISSIDGEQDPRNLDYIFTFMPDFIATYPLLYLKEAMFEIFSCYFPIDFNETSNDPAAITRNALATKLTNCLIASEDFHEMALDLALEKLESSLLVAKLDSLHLLNRLFVKSSCELIEANFERIWTIIKEEIFAGSESAVIGDLALDTLRIILETVTNANSISSHNMQTIVLGTILAYLDDMNQLRFKPAVRIAMACVAADPLFSGKKVLDMFIFKLSASTEDENVEQQRICIYDILGKIFQIGFSKCDEIYKNEHHHLFSKVHHIALNAFKTITSKSSFNPDYICASLAVLHDTASVINPANRHLLYEALNNIITHESLDITSSTKALIECFFLLHPKEFEKHCFDICMQNFANYTIFVRRKFFYNFFHLVKYKQQFAKPVINLLYTNVFGQQVSRDERLLALEITNNLMLDLYKDDCSEELNNKTDLITRFINLVRMNDNLDYFILNTISMSISLIMQSSPDDEQASIALDFLQNLNLPLDFKDLYIVKGLLSFLHQDVNLNVYFEILLDELSALSLTAENRELREAAHHLICTLINKMDTTQTANCNKVQQIIRRLESLIKAEKREAIELLAWLTKGLVHRDSKEVYEILDILISHLHHERLACEASHSFEIISAENTHLQLHLPVTNALFRQKFLETLLNRFGNRLDTHHHLNAFMHVLRTTPPTALELHIDKVGCILFKSLESACPSTLVTSLTICNDFVNNQHEYFCNNLNILIPACLKLSKFLASMQVRILALKLLSNLVKYPKAIVMPHKTDVIYDLTAVLDDRKRLVRKEAVLARNSWYMLDPSNLDE